MKAGFFNKLTVEESYISTTSGSLVSTIAATGSFPTPPTLFSTFPTIDGTATVKTNSTCLFPGAQINLVKRQSISGTNLSTTSPLSFEINGNVTSQFIVGDFLTKESGTGVFAGTGWVRITGSSYNSGTDKTTLTCANTTTPHTVGAMVVGHWRKTGFKTDIKYSMYSVNSSTTTTNAKYMMMTIKMFSVNGGPELATTVDILLPLNTPFRVVLPDSLILAQAFTTAITAISPSFTTLVDGYQLLRY